MSCALTAIGQINDVKELKILRDEKLRLKKLLAERDLDVDVMQEINTIKC